MIFRAHSLHIAMFSLACVASLACTEEHEPSECGDTCDEPSQFETGADVDGFAKETIDGTVQLLGGATVIVTCEPDDSSDDRIWESSTNSFGRFHVRQLPAVRWCEVTVHGYSLGDSENERVSNSIRINSGSGSKEVDLLLEVDPEGASDSDWVLTSSSSS